MKAWHIMLVQPGQIRTWLYTSVFKNETASVEITEAMEAFKLKNKSLNLSGFLITNGTSVMQLLEGENEAVSIMREHIENDERHTDLMTEVWELEAARAYPKWSMRMMNVSENETLFKEIQTARIATIATNIARMLFDATFQD